MKFEFYRQLIGKYSKTKFNENPSNGSQVVPCGETGRHDEANICFFLNFAKKKKPKTLAGHRHKSAGRGLVVVVVRGN
jgi:hypothetical protein